MTTIRRYFDLDHDISWGFFPAAAELLSLVPPSVKTVTLVILIGGTCQLLNKFLEVIAESKLLQSAIGQKQGVFEFHIHLTELEAMDLGIRKRREGEEELCRVIRSQLCKGIQSQLAELDAQGISLTLSCDDG